MFLVEILMQQVFGLQEFLIVEGGKYTELFRRTGVAGARTSHFILRLSAAYITDFDI